MIHPRIHVFVTVGSSSTRREPTQTTTRKLHTERLQLATGAVVQWLALLAHSEKVVSPVSVLHKAVCLLQRANKDGNRM